MSCEPKPKKARPAAKDESQSKLGATSGVCYICQEPHALKLNCACRGGGTEFAHLECIAKFNISKQERSGVSGFARICEWERCHICLQEFNGEEMLELSDLWNKHCKDNSRSPFDFSLLEAKYLKADAKIILCEFACAEKILKDVKIKLMLAGLSSDPFWHSVMHRLSLCAMRQKQYEKSEKIEKEVLQYIKKEHPEQKAKIRNIYLNMATLKYYKGQKEAALTCTNKILEELQQENVQGESRTKAMILKNMILVDKGDFEPAIQSIRTEIANVTAVFGQEHRQLDYQRFLLARALFLAHRYQECALVATDVLRTKKQKTSHCRYKYKELEQILEKCNVMMNTT